MARKPPHDCPAISPDIELTILRFVNAADNAQKLSRIVGADGKPALSKKAADAILAKARKGGGLRSLQETAQIPGVGAASVQALADHFARRVIDHEATAYRVAGDLLETLNNNPLLGKLMLVNPVRVLTEELGYVLTAEMAQKYLDAYAPSYGRMPARQDAFYDKLRRTGRGLRFINRVTFFESRRGPGGKAQAAGKQRRPVPKRPLPRGADVGGFDVTAQIPDDVCLNLFKFAFKDVPLTAEQIPLGEESYALAYLSPRNFRLRADSETGVYFELPFSLDTKQDNPMLAHNRLLLGDLGVLLRPQITENGGQFYVGVNAGLGALRRIVLHVTLLGVAGDLDYNLDANPDAPDDFNKEVKRRVPDIYAAMDGDPWGYIERLVNNKIVGALGANGFAISPMLSQFAGAGGGLTPTVRDLQFKIGDIGGRTALAVGVRLDLDWGDEPVYRSTAAADINAVPWFLELGLGNFAAAANGGLVAAVVGRFWREYMEGVYELRSGYELEIQALDAYNCLEGVVEMEFDVVVHTPWWLPNFDAELQFRFTIDGQNVHVYWSEDDDCCMDCASAFFPDLVDDLKERAIETVFRALTEGLDSALGGAVSSDQIAALTQSLMAAGDDRESIEAALTAAMQTLALGFRFPNSALAYVNVTNLFVQTLLAELRLFGSVEIPVFSWPDEEKYEAWIDCDIWEKGGPARQRGRRQSFAVFPSQRQRMMTVVSQTKKGGRANWLDAAADMADKIGGIVDEPEWWHIDLQGMTYRMIEPFIQMDWEFTCSDPSQMLTAVNGLQATVYANPLAGELDCRAKLTLTDAFARTCVCEKDLGAPYIRPVSDPTGWLNYFGEILDRLRELGFTVPGTGGREPAVQPEVDPEMRKLLGELEAMRQVRQQRRG